MGDKPNSTDADLPRGWTGGMFRDSRVSLAAQVLTVFVIVTTAPLVLLLSQGQADAHRAEERAIENAQFVARVDAYNVTQTLQDLEGIATSLVGLDRFWE